MKRTIFKGMMCLLLLGVGATSVYAQQQQRKDTLVVARDGTGEYRNIQEAVEAVRAFMDYTVTIYIKNGIYKEKLVIPSWVKNVQLVGESAEKTIITYDDHANINKMGTFRTMQKVEEAARLHEKKIEQRTLWATIIASLLLLASGIAGVIYYLGDSLTEFIQAMLPSVTHDIQIPFFYFLFAITIFLFLLFDRWMRKQYFKRHSS